MKRMFFLLFLLGIGGLACAQKNYLPIKVKNQWGFLEINGDDFRIDTSVLYDNLGDQDLPWFGQPGTQSGYHLVEKDGKLGLVTTDFKTVISPGWQEIHPISDQHFLVTDAGGYTVIDRTEKPLFPQNGYQAVQLVDNNDLSLFLLKQSGKWGVRKRGQQKWSLPPQYFEIEYLNVGTEGFFKVKKDRTVGDQWQIVDWNGAVLPGFKGTYERVVAASQTHIAVQKTNGKSKWSIRDVSGKELLILDPETKIKALNQHLLAYQEKGSNTYAVLVMKEAISPLVEKFSRLEPVGEGMVFFRIGQKAGLIKPNGRLAEISEVINPEIFAGKGNLLRIRGRVEGSESEQWGIYSAEAQQLILPCEYDSITAFHGALAYVYKGGKTGLLNASGKLLAVPRYDAIAPVGHNTEKVYCYWQDSVEVYPVDERGDLKSEAYVLPRTSAELPDQYHWPDYASPQFVSSSPDVMTAKGFTTQKAASHWEETQPVSEEDTLWVKEGERFWQYQAGNFQLMEQKEMEITIRPQSGSSSKKKKKRKKSSAPAPKQTKRVMKWVEQGNPVKFLRKASSVDWLLAYQDNGGLVSNELTYQGRNRFSVRKISVLLNENGDLLADIEMIGIRLSDFSDGLPYAAFMDLDGKIGLINKNGKQVVDKSGNPVRYTYISKASAGKMQVCHPASSFEQVGLNLLQLFQEFGVEAVKGSGDYISETASTKQAIWGYCDLNGQMVIPFEYEWAAPFQEQLAVNRKNGKWGAINADNIAVIPFEYDAIYPENAYWKVVKDVESRKLYYDDRGQSFNDEEKARLAMEGHRLFLVQSEDEPVKYGYADLDGNLIIPIQFDEASLFYEGLATVRMDKKWFFIDEKGEKAITIDPDIIGIVEVGNFNEGLCPIQKTTILNKQPATKYGYLNTKGQLAISPQFDRVGRFIGGLAVVDSLVYSVNNAGQKTGVTVYRGLIDKKGNPVTNYEFKEIFPFSEAGYARVIHSNLDRQGIIGKNGETLTNDYYTEVKDFPAGMATWGGVGKFWQVYDYDGITLALPVSNITAINHFAGEDLFVRDESDSWYHLSLENGEYQVKEDSFQLLLPLEHDYAYARLGRKSLLYGRNQSWLLPGEGQNFKLWSERLVGMKTRNGEYYANLGLQNVFHRNFDEVNKFLNDQAIVKYGGRSGLINSKGMFLLPPKFRAISREKEGPVAAQLSSSRYGLYSVEGEAVIPAEYDTIHYLENGIIRVEYADFVGYYTADGRELWGLGN